MNNDKLKNNLYEDFFYNNSDLLCIFDINFKIIKTNNNFINTLGINVGNIKDIDIFEYIHKDHLDETLNNFSIIDNNSEPYIFTSRIIKEKGLQKYIEWNIFKKDDHIFLTGRDVTERTNKNIKKDKLNYLIQYIIKYDPNAIAVHDKNLNYIYVSDRYLRDYNVKEKDILGKHHYEVFPDIPEKWKKVHQRALNGEIVNCNDDIFIREDGSTDYTSWECRPWYKPDGSIGGIILYTEVITKLKQKEIELFKLNKRLEATNEELEATNEELESTNEELEANYQSLEETNNELRIASEAKTSFLAKVSHELRTPMNGIVGGSELAKTCSNIEEIKEYIKIIEESSKRLLPIIDDILDISEIGKKAIKIIEEPFNLKCFIEEILYPLRIEANRKNLQFLCEMSLNNNEWLVGDKTKINQILNNIIKNAIKFTENGEIKIKITDKLLQNNMIEVSFNVKDTGIGISRDFDKNIFNIFEQQEKYITRKYGGTGLGLAIAKEYINLMNGEISFSSKENSGSEFKFHIILKKFDDTERIIQNNQNYIQINKRKILLVEDDKINQKLISKIIKDQNLLLDIVENGKEAIEKHEVNNYTLILMDLQMPIMDGLTATAIIREREKINKHSTPIIALTAHAGEVDKEKCYTVGMNDFISKPFKIDEFRNIISKYIS